MLPIILICGKAGSGKNAAADAIVAAFNGINICQADPLKSLCGEIFGFTKEQLYGDSQYRDALDTRPSEDPKFWTNAASRLHTAEGPWHNGLGIKEGLWRNNGGLLPWFASVASDPEKFTPRYCLQLLGTEYGRKKYGDDIWINAALRRAKKHLLDDYYGIVTISDGRFPNEILKMASKGGRSVLIRRPGVSSPHTHASETSLDGVPDHWYDGIIINDLNLVALQQAAKNIAEDIFGPKLVPSYEWDLDWGPIK